MATGIAKKRFYSVTKKYYEKWKLPKEKYENDTFQTGLRDTNSFDYIYY